MTKKFENGATAVVPMAGEGEDVVLIDGRGWTEG